MIYLLSSIALVAIILTIRKINLFIQFTKQVKQLFAELKNISDKKFNYQQLEGLPASVQRYFNLILKEEQPYISYARMARPEIVCLQITQKRNSTTRLFRSILTRNVATENYRPKRSSAEPLFVMGAGVPGRTQRCRYKIQMLVS